MARFISVQDDYRLLCMRGCEPLDAYKKCNLGEAPAKALVGRESYKRTNQGRSIMSMFNGNDDLLERSESRAWEQTLQWPAESREHLFVGQTS